MKRYWVGLYGGKFVSEGTHQNKPKQHNECAQPALNVCEAEK